MSAVPLRLPAAYRLVSYDTLGSTNDEARRLARDGAAEGTLVCAAEQTAGRGRRGRRWVSPPGNLYASLILRPACAPDRAAQLGFAAALAVGEALGELVPGLDRSICCKWPNDVLIGHRKIAGILLESERAAGDAPAFLVVGVGVNLVSAPAAAEFPATSLAALCASPPAPACVLATFATRFDCWMRRWRDEGFAPVRAAWRARAMALGEPIRVRLETATLHGRFADIDEQGALLLETDGQQRRISAGDVFPVAR